MPDMNKKLISCCLFIVIQCIAGQACADYIINNATFVLIEPLRISAQPNQTFSADINVRNISNLCAFQFDIIFDPQVLTITNATPGDYITSSSRSILASEAVITSGKLTVAVITKDDADGPSGNGKLATIQCTINNLPGNGLKYTETTLNLDNVLMADRLGDQLSAHSLRDASVIIKLSDETTPVHIKMKGDLRFGQIIKDIYIRQPSVNFVNTKLFGYDCLN
ncbi:MAG: hypothetical protein HQK75_16340 [Candidatus Magnetomorum sp.]|nr:hypothetical protein [Candidatus Magnetomorum sp.]